MTSDESIAAADRLNKLVVKKKAKKILVTVAETNDNDSAEKVAAVKVYEIEEETKTSKLLQPFKAMSESKTPTTQANTMTPPP